VYRGADPSVQGQYFFADEVSSHFWELNPLTHAVTNIDGQLTPNTGSLSGPSSFSEDVFGNLYIVSYGTGAVFRIDTNQVPEPVTMLYVTEVTLTLLGLSHFDRWPRRIQW